MNYINEYVRCRGKNGSPGSDESHGPEIKRITTHFFQKKIKKDQKRSKKIKKEHKRTTKKIKKCPSTLFQNLNAAFAIQAYSNLFKILFFNDADWEFDSCQFI
jgi:hypothetical protein